jgi:hypothetical protein
MPSDVNQDIDFVFPYERGNLFRGEASRFAPAVSYRASPISVGVPHRPSRVEIKVKTPSVEVPEMRKLQKCFRMFAKLGGDTANAKPLMPVKRRPLCGGRKSPGGSPKMLPRFGCAGDARRLQQAD